MLVAGTSILGHRPVPDTFLQNSACHLCLIIAVLILSKFYAKWKFLLRFEKLSFFS
jgi:hypothetical protein